MWSTNVSNATWRFFQLSGTHFDETDFRNPETPRNPGFLRLLGETPQFGNLWGFPLRRKFRTPAGRPPGAAMLASSFVREGRADSLLSFSWQLTKDRETLPACTLHILKVNFRKNGRGRGKIGTRQCTELLCDRLLSHNSRMTKAPSDTLSSVPNPSDSLVTSRSGASGLRRRSAKKAWEAHYLNVW
ncbi:hypothetical protein BKA93DRAFT_746351 [Sparassis latifolia]